MLSERVEESEPTHSEIYGVLIADDDDDVREVLGQFLRSSGFRVWLARNGAEAIHQYRLSSHLIHVVLLDICMPGTDGPSTLAELKRWNRGVICCFMSGHLGAYTHDDLKAMDIARIFRKPFSLAEVVHALRALARHAADASSTGASCALTSARQPQPTTAGHD